MADAIPVELRQTEAGWQLLRGGEPYFINGAGGEASLSALAAAGGNSIRTWDFEGIDARLDEAHALGLTVTVGIWLGHERHGFDYSDEAQVAEQFERAREAVLRFRDHPAVLMWGIGNEMEGFEAADNPLVWKAVNDIAAMAKELDPNHPTMTVTAEIGGERIAYVHGATPAIDIHGINAYGGAGSIAERLAAAGASKPFVLTEFGPIGPWEANKTEWGAPYEQTSSEKADFYRQTWEDSVLAAPGRALGGYAFTWGEKMEGTATWFGMFLRDGARLAVVDTMSELWTGQAPANRAPAIGGLDIISGSSSVDPEAVVKAVVTINDPDKDALTYRWVLRPESGDYATGGDFRPDLPEIEDAIVESSLQTVTVRMPEEPGPYRLFVYAYDNHGAAATANTPLLVKGERRTVFPVAVYDESFEGMRWVPSGWMGNVDGLALDGASTVDPHDGAHAIRIRYEGTFGWAGIAWQHPANNWGDEDGGFDMTGATSLELWARGEYGGEKVKFGVGLLESDRAYPDSAIESTGDLRLSNEWQQYRIPLKGKDLSSLKTGFVVVLTGRASPVTVHLDRIRFVK